MPYPPVAVPTGLYASPNLAQAAYMQAQLRAAAAANVIYTSNLTQARLPWMMPANTQPVANGTTTKPAASRLSSGTAETVPEEDDDEEDEEEEIDAYWEDPEWVPLMKSGKQRTPNMIRNELQKYIDNSSQTKKAVMDRMRVGSKSFYKFMNPKTYKDQWSAVSNDTYWAAARLLEAERNKKAKKGSSSKKRSRDDEQSANNKKTKQGAMSKTQILELIACILQVEDVDETVVYETCSEVVKKVWIFIASPRFPLHVLLAYH